MFEETNATVSNPVSGDLRRTTVCATELRGDQRRVLGPDQLPHRRRAPVTVSNPVSGDLRRTTVCPADYSGGGGSVFEATIGAVSDPVSGDLRRDTASRRARRRPLVVAVASASRSPWRSSGSSTLPPVPSLVAGAGSIAAVGAAVSPGGSVAAVGTAVSLMVVEVASSDPWRSSGS